MGITYDKRPRLEDLESKKVKPFDTQAFALSESQQAGYVEKVDVDTVLDYVNDELDDIKDRLRERNI